VNTIAKRAAKAVKKEIRLICFVLATIPGRPTGDTQSATHPTIIRDRVFAAEKNLTCPAVMATGDADMGL
jgi:hypothetical protein